EQPERHHRGPLGLGWRLALDARRGGGGGGGREQIGQAARLLRRSGWRKVRKIDLVALGEWSEGCHLSTSAFCKVVGAFAVDSFLHQPHGEPCVDPLK